MMPNNMNVNGSDQLDFDPRAPGKFAVDQHYDNLVTRVKYTRPGGQDAEHHAITETSYRISFAELQRMHLRKIQSKLINHAVHMRITKRESRDWESDLAQYSRQAPKPSRGSTLLVTYMPCLFFVKWQLRGLLYSTSDERLRLYA